MLVERGEKKGEGERQASISKNRKHGGIDESEQHKRDNEKVRKRRKQEAIKRIEEKRKGGT